MTLIAGYVTMIGRPGLPPGQRCRLAAGCRRTALDAIAEGALSSSPVSPASVVAGTRERSCRRLPPRTAGPSRRGGCNQSATQTATQMGSTRRYHATSGGSTVTQKPWSAHLHDTDRHPADSEAQDSGSCVRKDVGVQVPPRPPDVGSTYPTEGEN